MSRKGGPPRVDSMKQTVRREKGRAGSPPAPGAGSGSGGGEPTEPPQPQDPASGAPFAEPGLTRSGKRSKRTRGY